MKILSCICTLVFLLQSFVAQASSQEKMYEGPVQWDSFREYMLQEQEAEEMKGLGFMISGTIAGVGGIIAAEQATEIFSRTVFSIASNVGFAAIGVGALSYWTYSERDSFFYAIDGSSLSPHQRNEVLQRYLTKERKERGNRRWIRVATHALIAAVNIYSASRESQSDIRSLYYFLGAANTVLAVSYSF